METKEMIMCLAMNACFLNERNQEKQEYSQQKDAE